MIRSGPSKNPSNASDTQKRPNKKDDYHKKVKELRDVTKNVRSTDTFEMEKFLEDRHERDLSSKHGFVVPLHESK